MSIFRPPDLGIAVAAAALCAAYATPSMAQSSVTVFGIADLAVRYIDNEGGVHQYQVTSGSNASSRIGFRGQEDLGAGWYGSFWLESQFNLDTGNQLGVFWYRRSTVSLTQTDLGEIRIGRDYVPTHLSWSRFDPFGYVGIGAVANYLASPGPSPISQAFGAAPSTVARSSNALQYYLPKSFHGFEGNIMMAPQEGGTAANYQDKLYGARLGYGNGPFFVSGATVRVRNDVSAGQTLKDTAFGTSFDASFAKLSGGVRRFEIQNARQTNFLLAAVVPIGRTDLKFSWNRATMSGSVGATNIGNDKSDQFAVGAVYSLSKRTVLYTTASTVRNKGNARFVVAGAPAVGAGRDSSGIEFGMRQEF